MLGPRKFTDLWLKSLKPPAKRYEKRYEVREIDERRWYLVRLRSVTQDSLVANAVLLGDRLW